MPCLIGILGFFFPRVIIVLLVLFTDYIGRAYDNNLWPFLGFFFAPFTTLAYAAAKNEGGSVTGIWLIVVIVAILLDIGVIGGGGREAKKRRRLGKR